MKKIYLFLFTTILAINVAYPQSDWITYKVDNKLSVKMPAQPKQIDENTKMAMDKDSVYYIVAVVDFVKTAGIDSAQLVSYAPNPVFANSIKSGMLKELPGLTLGDVKIDKLKGYYSYKIEGGSEEKKMKFFTYDIIIGSKMYGLTVILSDNKSTKGKDDFFSSLVLNVAHDQGDWITYKIDNKLSVKIPHQPDKADKYTVYVRTKDSIVYAVSVVDFLKMDGLDSADMASKAPTAEFASTLKDSMLSAMSGYTLGDVKISKWKDFICYNIEGANNSMKLKVYFFVVFIGTNAYSLDIILPENKSLKGEYDFFGSLALNK